MADNIQPSMYSIASESASQNSFLQQQLSNVMRSFKDELSFNLQTLNLTLNGLTSSMNNLNGKIGALDPNTAGRYINSGLNSGAFLGNVSQQFANYRPLDMRNPLLGGVINTNFRRPFNVSPQEYYMGSDINKATMMSGGISSMIHYVPSAIATAGSIAGMAGGTLGPVGAAVGATIGVAGAVADYAINSGTENYMDMAKMLLRMGGRYNSIPTWKEALKGARGIQDLSYEEVAKSTPTSIRLGEGGYRDITMMGLQGDLLHGADMEKLVGQVRELGEVVKVMTGILGSPDTKTTMDAIIQMKNMGLNLATPNGLAQAKRMAANAYGYGFSQSIAPDEMIKAGMQVAQSGFGTQGIPAGAGINIAMHNIASVSEMYKRGYLSSIGMAEAGGPQAAAAKLTGLYANTLTSDLGQMYMMSGLSADGTFDITKANSAASKGYMNMYREGLGNMYGGTSMNPLLRQSFVKANRSKILAQIGNASIPDQLSGDNFLLDAELSMGALGYRGGSINEKLYHGISYLMDKGLDAGTAELRMRKLLSPDEYMAMHRENLFNNAVTNLAEKRFKTSIGYQLEDTVFSPLQKYINEGQQYMKDIIRNAVDSGAATRPALHDIISEGDKYLKDKDGNKLAGGIVTKYDIKKDKDGLEYSKKRFDSDTFNRIISNYDPNSEEIRNFGLSDKKNSASINLAVTRNSGSLNSASGNAFVKDVITTIQEGGGINKEGLLLATNADKATRNREAFQRLGTGSKIDTAGKLGQYIDTAGLQISLKDLNERTTRNRLSDPLQLASDLLHDIDGVKLDENGELAKAISGFDPNAIPDNKEIQNMISRKYRALGSYAKALQATQIEFQDKYSFDQISEQGAKMAAADKNKFRMESRFAIATGTKAGRELLSTLTGSQFLTGKDISYGEKMSQRETMVSEMAAFANNTEQTNAVSKFGLDVINNNSIFKAENLNHVSDIFNTVLKGKSASEVVGVHKKLDTYLKEHTELNKEQREKFIQDFLNANPSSKEEILAGIAGAQKLQHRMLRRDLYEEHGLITTNKMINSAIERYNPEDYAGKGDLLSDLQINSILADQDFEGMGLKGEELKKYKAYSTKAKDLREIQESLTRGKILTEQQQTTLAKYGIEGTMEAVNAGISKHIATYRNDDKESLTNIKSNIKDYSTEKTADDCVVIDHGQPVLLVKTVSTTGKEAEEALRLRKRLDELEKRRTEKVSTAEEDKEYHDIILGKKGIVAAFKSIFGKSSVDNTKGYTSIPM